jgi:hypothetical protein
VTIRVAADEKWQMGLFKSTSRIETPASLCSRAVTAKSTRTVGLAALGALLCVPAMVWLSDFAGRPSNPLERIVAFSAALAVGAGCAYFWSIVVGNLSRERLWSPPWTIVTANTPFVILGLWIFFFSRYALQERGVLRMMLLICAGSWSGRIARSRAYPELSDEELLSADVPTTLFPK